MTKTDKTKAAVVRILMETAALLRNSKLAKGSMAVDKGGESVSLYSKAACGFCTEGALTKVVEQRIQSYPSYRRSGARNRLMEAALRALVASNKGIAGTYATDDSLTDFDVDDHYILRNAINIWNDLPRRRKGQVVDALVRAAYATDASLAQTAT